MPDSELRPEISASWKRCESNGLTPEQAVDNPAFGDFEATDLLHRAAQPVIDALMDHFDGLRFALLVADKKARLVEVRSGDRRLQSHMAAAGGVPGLSMLEEHCGTNSVGTALELRRPVAVHGDEHFFDGWKRFSGFGQPIINRVTGRVEGVMDIACERSDDSPLLRPVISQATKDIEDRLLQAGRSSHVHLLAEYRSALRRNTSAMVLALGSDVNLESPAIAGLLEADDRILIAGIASELRPRASVTNAVTLTRGLRVALTLTRADHAGDGVICELEALDDDHARHSARGWDLDDRIPLCRGRAPYGPTLRASGTGFIVHGSPGTGRTTAVRELAGDAVRVLPFQAGEWSAETEQRWRTALAVEAGPDGALVVIEDVHLLPQAVAHRLATRLPSQAWTAATSIPLQHLGPEGRSLVSRFPAVVELRPLSDVGPRIPAILRSMLRDRGASRPLSAQLQTALSRLPWPGNLRELASVADHLAQRSGRLALTPDDLPEGYRRTTVRRQLMPLEQAEAEAIRSAMEQFNGNKLQAANYLGISRTTLYKNLRRYDIQTPG